MATKQKKKKEEWRRRLIPWKRLPPHRLKRNDGRASNCVKPIELYTKATGSDAEDVVTDFLVDLRHWCDRNKIDFAECVRVSDTHYSAEIDPDDDIDV